MTGVRLERVRLDDVVGRSAANEVNAAIAEGMGDARIGEQGAQAVEAPAHIEGPQRVELSGDDLDADDALDFLPTGNGVDSIAGSETDHRGGSRLRMEQ